MEENFVKSWFLSSFKSWVKVKLWSSLLDWCDSGREKVSITSSCSSSSTSSVWPEVIVLQEQNFNQVTVTLKDFSIELATSRFILSLSLLCCSAGILLTVSRSVCFRATVGSGAMSQVCSISLWMVSSFPPAAGSGRETGTWTRTLRENLQRKGLVMLL